MAHPQVIYLYGQPIKEISREQLEDELVRFIREGDALRDQLLDCSLGRIRAQAQAARCR